MITSIMLTGVATQPTVHFLILLDQLCGVSLQLLMLCVQGSSSCAEIQKHIGWHMQMAHAAVTISWAKVTACLLACLSD